VFPQKPVKLQSNRRVSCCRRRFQIYLQNLKGTLDIITITFIVRGTQTTQIVVGSISKGKIPNNEKVAKSSRSLSVSTAF